MQILIKITHLISLSSNKQDYSTITTITTFDKLNFVDLKSKAKIQEWIERVKAEIENDVDWNEHIERGAEAFQNLVFKFVKKGLIRS